MSPPPENLPRVFSTVVDMLVDACARFPHHTALRCADRQLSYLEYRNCVAGFADELISDTARGARASRWSVPIRSICRSPCSPSTQQEVRRF